MEQTNYILDVWNQIHLSRRVENVERDLADACMMRANVVLFELTRAVSALVAEFIHKFVGDMVEPQNYPTLSPEDGGSIADRRLRNWTDLNRTFLVFPFRFLVLLNTGIDFAGDVFHAFGFDVPISRLRLIAEETQGVVQQVTAQLQDQV